VKNPLHRYKNALLHAARMGIAYRYKSSRNTRDFILSGSLRESEEQTLEVFDREEKPANFVPWKAHVGPLEDSRRYKQYAIRPIRMHAGSVMGWIRSGLRVYGWGWLRALVIPWSGGREGAAQGTHKLNTRSLIYTPKEGMHIYITKPTRIASFYIFHPRKRSLRLGCRVIQH